MERYTMFLDWKNQYCQNDSTTQGNLQIQCNPYQITNGIFHRTRTKNFLICMETQKTPNSQSNPKKEKWSWRNQVPWLQTILQSYSNQDSTVLAQKQKYRSMEQYEKPRNKLMHLWSINLRQRRKDSLFNKWCWENWTATCKRMKLEHSLTPYRKTNSKWIKDLNVRLDTMKLLEENTGRTLFDVNCSNIFLDPPSRVMKIKTKINKWDLIKLYSFAQQRKP